LKHKFPGDWRYSQKNMELRQQVLLVLLKHYGDGDHPNLSMYECADEWINKGNVSTSGLVKYYKAYYTK